LFTISQAISTALTGAQVQVIAGAIFARVSAFVLQGAQAQAQAGTILRGAALLGAQAIAAAGTISRFDVKNFLIGAAVNAQAGIFTSDIIVPSEIAADHVAKVTGESHLASVLFEQRVAHVIIEAGSASVIQQ
jgi:hypothetical protein